MGQGTGAARRHFRKGLSAWGYRGTDKPFAPSDPVAALEHFRRASEVDPEMCDAWLGRRAFGDRDREIPRRMLASHPRFGEDLRREGLEPWSFACRFDVDVHGLLTKGIVETADLWLLEAAERMREGDVRGAGSLLETDPGRSSVWRYALGSAYALAERWPDVVNILRPVVTEGNGAEKAAAQFAVGVALARLGLLHEASARLDEAAGSEWPRIADSAAFMRALVARAQGEEDEAQRRLQGVYARLPHDPEVAAALRDPGYGIAMVTPAAIAARSDPWDPASAGDAAPAEAETDRSELLRETLTELDDQIGLDEVKAQVRSLVSQMQLAVQREARGIRSARRPRHLVFEGPPGTGKTTIARIVGKLYYALGLLETKGFVEAGRSDLVAGYLGQTAIKTRAVIDSALDGVLFIDEAYTLDNSSGLEGGDAYGREAIGVLLARMENDRDRLLVIIAGYPDEIDRFLASNAGLESRFPTRIRFERYGAAELALIAARSASRTTAPSRMPRRRRSKPRHGAWTGRSSTAWAMPDSHASSSPMRPRSATTGSARSRRRASHSSRTPRCKSSRTTTSAWPSPVGASADGFARRIWEPGVLPCATWRR